MKNEKLIFIFLTIVLLILTACTQNSERKANEEKILKLAENMGGNTEEVKENLKNMSDEDLKKASEYIDEDGNIDIEKAMQESVKEQSEEDDKISSKLKLSEITSWCEAVEDPASRKYEDTQIQITGTGIDENGTYYDLENLDGNVEILVYGYVESTQQGDWGRTFKKGNLLAKINGKLDEVTKFQKSSSIFGTSKRYVLNLNYDNIDKEKVQLTTTSSLDEYGYSYVSIPIQYKITYTDLTGKEYLYVDGDYFSEYDLSNGPDSLNCMIVKSIKS